VFNRLERDRSEVTFRTLKSGALTVSRDGELLAMNFPARPAKSVPAPNGLVAALGKTPVEVLASQLHMAVYENAADVAALAPDFAELAKVDCFGVIATAPGEDGIDFVSRFFAPSVGIPEDPVTGAAHCTLVPYWTQRLGKKTFEARQISKRGGKLTCTLDDDRVIMAGRAVLYLEGTIAI